MTSGACEKKWKRESMSAKRVDASSLVERTERTYEVLGGSCTDKRVKGTVRHFSRKDDRS